MPIYSFPQADNLGFIYQIFCEFPEEGLNRYSFAEKYGLHDRQGAYYLNALCFIGLAEKRGKNTFLNENGKFIQCFPESFRKKVFILSIFENQLICDLYNRVMGMSKQEAKDNISIVIAGAYGINDKVTLERRSRTLMSWYKWIKNQDFVLEERYE